MTVMMPKPKSRPKCPSCHGEKEIKLYAHPEFDSPEETWPCAYCDGQGYDPYYTGQEENDDVGDVASE